MDKALLCRLKLCGLPDCTIDENNNIIECDKVNSPLVILPYGVHGICGVGFSGLNELQIVKFNKDLVELSDTAFANCKNLKEIYIYESQLSLVSNLVFMNKNLIIKIRRDPICFIV